MRQLYFLDNFRNEERKHKEAKGKENLPGEKFCPPTVCPNLLYCSDEECKDKGPHDNAQGRSGKIISETHFSEAHPEVHGRKREIDKAQIEYGCKTVSLDPVIVFFQFVPDERGGKISSEIAPDKEGQAGADHSPEPYVKKAQVRAEYGSAQGGKKCSGYEKADSCGIYAHIHHGRPKPGSFEQKTQPFGSKILL